MTAAARPAASRLGNPTVLDLLSKARWQGSKKLPYLSKGMWALDYVITDAVPTMAVDRRWRVYVNPAHVAECVAESFDALIAGVVHETLHPFLRHPDRAEAAHCGDRAHANVCEDCELVQHIQAAGIRIWSKDVTPESFGWPRGLSFEEYYKLPRPKAPSGGGGQQGGGGGKPGQPGKGGGNATCSGGSGATGVKGPWELPEPGDPGFKKGEMKAGLSESEAAIVAAGMADAIREHARQHGRGSVPAGLLRWAEEMIETPPVDWRALVTARTRYWIDAKRGPTASYARPSRRSAGGLILPVHRNPRANVVVVGDTSGSMGETDMGKIVGFVYQAIEALGAIKAIGCDAAATEPVECRHIDDLREALRGGGGTDMALGIEAAAQNDPDAIVVVTDGDTGWPQAQPDVPVIVVLTRSSRHPIPLWADVIDATDCGGDDD